MKATILCFPVVILATFCQASPTLRSEVRDQCQKTPKLVAYSDVYAKFYQKHCSKGAVCLNIKSASLVAKEATMCKPPSGQRRRITCQVVRNGAGKEICSPPSNTAYKAVISCTKNGGEVTVNSDGKTTSFSVTKKNRKGQGPSAGFASKTYSSGKCYPQGYSGTTTNLDDTFLLDCDHGKVVTC